MPIFVRSQEIEHVIGTDGRFALRVTSPDVELRAVDGTVARVRVEFALGASSEAEADDLFERARFEVQQGTGSLEVSEPKRSEVGLGSIVRILGIGSARADATITAEVPRGAAVAYDGVSADLTATGFGGDQQYRTVSGDLVLDRLAGRIQVRGVSGDVSLRADDPIGLEINTVSGDISAFAPRFDELRVVTVSGDVELEGELAAEQHRVETVSGDLSFGILGGVTLEVRGLSSDVHVSVPHRSEGSRDRRRYVIGDGRASLLFSSMSGDVFARDPRRFSRPAPPVPPGAPEPPVPPVPAERPMPNAAEQLEILRALERGEIDVEEASARLAGGVTDA